MIEERWVEAQVPAGEPWARGPESDAFVVRAELGPDEPSPEHRASPFHVFVGESAAYDAVSLMHVLTFAHLEDEAFHWTNKPDRYLPLRRFGEKHGLLGVRRVTARSVVSGKLGPLIEGEPISAWWDEAQAVALVIRQLGMLGAFTLDRQEHVAQDWEWFVAEGTARGPRDRKALVQDTRARINAKLREHAVVLSLGEGDQLPLPYALSQGTQIAAMWKRIAECAGGVSRIGFCEICGKPMVYEGKYLRPGRRSDARTCSVRCRVEKHRREKNRPQRTTRKATNASGRGTK